MDQIQYANWMLDGIKRSRAQSLKGKLPNHFKYLTLEESIIFRWQYPNLSGGFGGFYTTLMSAIVEADDDNLLRLSMGFKEMVTGLIKFRSLPGWWTELEHKLKRLGYVEVIDRDRESEKVA